jgi:hypothetical protein
MILDLLIGLAILSCLLRFAYRLTFEGKGPLSQPFYYYSFRRWLDLTAMFGSILTVPLLWWRIHWWAALLWVLVYLAIETWVTSIGDRRAINGFIVSLRSGAPEASQQELQKQAIGLLEFTKKKQTRNLESIYSDTKESARVGFTLPSVAIRPRLSSEIPLTHAATFAIVVLAQSRSRTMQHPRSCRAEPASRQASEM